MKALKVFAEACRFAVGLLFIFSGLVKINDPLGLAIKLEEYFHVFAADFGSFFNVFVPIALPLAVFVVVLEMVLGVALIVGYQLKITSWALLVMIVFFTFLTGYSAILDKVTDCGCFGDAIPLTPVQSFYKDLILLALIGVIFAMRHHLKPLLAAPMNFLVTGSSALLGFVLCGVALAHLPYLDFRSYHIGANIPEKMQSAPQTEPLKFRYFFEKNGQVTTFDSYPNPAPEYDTMYYELLNPEAQPEPPEITDFYIWSAEGDATQQMLTGPQLVIIFHQVAKAKGSNMPEVAQLVTQLDGQVPVSVLSSSQPADVQSFLGQYSMQAPLYFGDETVLKAMIRGNPGLMLLQDGVVLDKWHSNDTPTAEEVMNLLGK